MGQPIAAMDDRATYQVLRDYLFEDESALEISFAEFQECFPKKYQKSAEIKRLYKEMKKQQQEAKRTVVANLKGEYALVRGRPEDEEIKETLAVLKEVEQDLAEYKHAVEDLVDLQEQLHTLEDKLNNLAEHDRPLKKAKLGLPALHDLKDRLNVD